MVRQSLERTTTILWKSEQKSKNELRQPIWRLVRAMWTHFRWQIYDVKFLANFFGYFWFVSRPATLRETFFKTETLRKLIWQSPAAEHVAFLKSALSTTNEMSSDAFKTICFSQNICFFLAAYTARFLFLYARSCQSGPIYFVPQTNIFLFFLPFQNFLTNIRFKKKFYENFGLYL